MVIRNEAGVLNPVIAPGLPATHLHSHQLGRAAAPMKPHRVQTMRGPNAGMGMSPPYSPVPRADRIGQDFIIVCLCGRSGIGLVRISAPGT